ncbi:riboflavin-specific deaminase-like protein [Pseudorhizobium tarimense]|uniref:Riboflavin-specific deaminase-like protein n=1 Tax=Pseudorhizobium tarimense TaxID=1079109 RepID=A0ABV2H8U1_9HYPH|nr:RibD family protein [Pseudorhizobium tarimense]MCJ8520084.1 RibD family protein [Pseudorhizobium tarimense]
MQSAKMTGATWDYLRSMREQGQRQITRPVNDDKASLSLYEPIARRGRPLVLAQVGQSLDGRVATTTGDAQDVSGCDGISHLHRCRALVDAVVVGVGTVVADNPSLSVRAVPGENPVRVVIDCNGRMPQQSKMLTDGGAPVLVVQADDILARRLGHEVVRLPRCGEGLHPKDILDCLAERGLTSVLIEGGAKTIARFIDADLVDRLHVAIAPIIIGSGPMGISLAPVDRLSEARRPTVNVYNIGTDIVFDCDFRRPAASLETSDQGQDVLVTHPA